MDRARAARALGLTPPATRRGEPGYLAPRWPWTAFFDWYFRRLFAAHFASVRWCTPPSIASWDRTIPTLFVSNHTNWWDGFLVWLVLVALRLEPHVVMEARNLDRYAAFKRVGVVPMRRDGTPRQMAEDLADAGTVLRPGSALWLFPSGTRCPARARPLRFERGAAQLILAREAPLRVVPVAVAYEFLGEQLPELFVLVGEGWLHRPSPAEPAGAAGRRALTARLEADVGAVLEDLDQRLAREALDGFRILVQGKLSVNKRLDRVRHAAGLLEGEFEARNG